MSTLVNSQPVNIPTGQQTLGPVSLPDGLSKLTIHLARCTTATPTIWPNAATVIDVRMFVSLDGGVTWVPSGGVTSPGGIVQRGGVDVAELVMTWALGTAQAGVSRQVKSTIAVANGPLVSTVTIEAN